MWRPRGELPCTAAPAACVRGPENRANLTRIRTRPWPNGAVKHSGIKSLSMAATWALSVAIDKRASRAAAYPGGGAHAHTLKERPSPVSPLQRSHPFVGSSVPANSSRSVAETQFCREPPRFMRFEPARTCVRAQRDEIYMVGRRGVQC
ncbi:hypothetical protein MRX96_039195 [Rhipicephalus microplus]